MIEMVIGLLLMLWDVLKPTLIGGFYLLLVVGIFKWWILDGITQRLDAAILHLSEIEKDLARSKDHLYNMRDAIANVEEELKWWSDGNTLAKQIINRLNAIERK